MKLYDYKMAPNARRVRMFAAEKGIELEMASVDLGQREQLEDGYKAVNPRLAVPALELDDGTVITESIAICRYLDEIQPDPALFGTGAKGKATVEMWHRRMELEGLQPVADAVRNSVNFFAGRAIAGPVDFEQIPALAERGKQRIDLFYAMLDAHLADNAFIAGEAFSIADIAAVVACDFAKVAKKRIGDETPNLKRWYDAVSARPSAAA
ncbi:MAG: glutathione S-transferase family protein [Magnetovibrio sp.]|nr:glutathione S-transferase family protein [Magnetovibrio sp.]